MITCLIAGNRLNGSETLLALEGLEGDRDGRAYCCLVSLELIKELTSRLSWQKNLI